MFLTANTTQWNCFVEAVNKVGTQVIRVVGWS